MRLWRMLVLAGITLPGSAAMALPSNCVVGVNVYYISQAGSDSNTQAQAKNKATPWKHAPYMASFTGSYSHTLGDCFVFRGGDTWVYADRINVVSGGTSSAPDYYGVDPQWSAGGSWTRPRFDIGGTVAVGDVEFAFTNANYITFDNWEIVHAGCNSGGSMANPNWIINEFGKHGIVVTNSYIHNFSTGGSPNYCGSGNLLGFGTFTTPPMCDGSFDHNIVDGSDGQGGGSVELFHSSACDPIKHNVMHDVCSVLNAGVTEVAFNLIYNVNVGCTGGQHSDGIFNQISADIHDNVLHDTSGLTLAIVPNGGASHIYNNVIYHMSTDAIVVGNVAGKSSGDVYIYNNTVEPGSINDQSAVYMATSLTGTLHIHNQHHILRQTDITAGYNGICYAGACGTASGGLDLNLSDDLIQSLAAANAAGYSSLQTFAYSPTSLSSPTVGKGANLSGVCSPTVLLCKDTSYGAVASGGAPPVEGRPAVSRPIPMISSLTSPPKWNIGAYQYSTQSGGLPERPTMSSATVQ